MPYPIFDIELTRSLPEIRLAPHHNGYAVLLRYEGKPINFWLEERPPNQFIKSEFLKCRIAESTKEKILAEYIRDELVIEPEHWPQPPLTVAVCTKDRPSLLARCLKSLKQNGCWPEDTGPPIEILVVDNAPSNHCTRKLVNYYKKVRYCCESKPGLDFARNKAIAGARGQWIAFLDDDVVVDRYWLSGLWEALSENPDAGAITGLVLPYELETDAQIVFERGGGFRRGFQKIRYHGQRLENNPLYPCGAGIFGAGANMAIRRDVLEKLNGFDEALDTGAPLPGGGDLDIFYRIIHAGFPLVYEPRFLVFHQHRIEIKNLRRQYRSWGLGFMAYVTKSIETDPSNRQKFLRLILWWFKYQWRHLYRSIRKTDEIPFNLRIAELYGGIFGLLGEYHRSKKRIKMIKKTIT